MKLNRWLFGTIIGTQFAFASFAADDADLQALKKQIQELDQKVRILEREREIQLAAIKGRKDELLPLCGQLMRHALSFLSKKP